MAYHSDETSLFGVDEVIVWLPQVGDSDHPFAVSLDVPSDLVFSELRELKPS